MSDILPKGAVASPIGKEDSGRPPVYLQKKTLKKIMQWAAEHKNCWAILYGVEAEKDGLLISGACRVKKAERQMGQTVFSSKTWRNIREQKQEKYPRLDTVGICMVEKGGHCRLSSDLRLLAQGYFSQPWQVVLTVDPQTWQCRFYRWEGKTLHPAAGYYLVTQRDEPSDSSQTVQKRDHETSALPMKTQGDPEREKAVSPVSPASSPPDAPSKGEESSIPKTLVDEVKAYGRRVRFLTGLVAALLVVVLGAGTFLYVQQRSRVQPVWSQQQADLESRVAALEDAAGQDNSLLSQIDSLKNQLSDLKEKNTQQEQLIQELSDCVAALEQQLSGGESEGTSSLPEYHVVQPGETLSSISIHYFGTPDKAFYLAAINGIDDPDYLQAGTTLLLSR